MMSASLSCLGSSCQRVKLILEYFRFSLSLSFCLPVFAPCVVLSYVNFINVRGAADK